jgi:hypothetical protein
MLGMDSLVIRTATAADADALRRLAALDSRRLAGGPHLIAELDGRLVAALALTGGDAVADPFTRTDGIVALLRRREGHLRPAERPGLRLLQPRPRLG